MPTLKRHLGEMDSRWLNPEGALDKQGEERAVSGRNFALLSVPLQQAALARIQPQPLSGVLSVALGGGQSWRVRGCGSASPLTPRPAAPSAPVLLLGHFFAGCHCQGQDREASPRLSLGQPLPSWPSSGGAGVCASPGAQQAGDKDSGVRPPSSSLQLGGVAGRECSGSLG